MDSMLSTPVNHLELDPIEHSSIFSPLRELISSSGVECDDAQVKLHDLICFLNLDLVTIQKLKLALLNIKSPQQLSELDLEDSLNSSSGLKDNFGDVQNQLRQLGQLSGLKDGFGGIQDSLGQLSGLKDSLGQLSGLKDSLGQLSGLKDSLGQLGQLKDGFGGLQDSLGQLSGLKDSLGQLSGLKDSLGQLSGLKDSLGQLGQLSGLKDSLGQLSGLKDSLGQLGQLSGGLQQQQQPGSAMSQIKDVLTSLAEKLNPTVLPVLPVYLTMNYRSCRYKLKRHSDLLFSKKKFFIGDVPLKAITCSSSDIFLNPSLHTYPKELFIRIGILDSDGLPAFYTTNDICYQFRLPVQQFPSTNPITQSGIRVQVLRVSIDTPSIIQLGMAIYIKERHNKHLVRLDECSWLNDVSIDLQFS